MPLQLLLVQSHRGDGLFIPSTFAIRLVPAGKLGNTNAFNPLTELNHLYETIPSGYAHHQGSISKNISIKVFEREVADSFSLGSVDGKISVQIPISQGKMQC